MWVANRFNWRMVLIRGRKLLSVSYCANKYTKRRNNFQMWDVLTSSNFSNGSNNGNLQNKTDIHVEMGIHQIISNRSHHQLLMNESDLHMRSSSSFFCSHIRLNISVIAKRKIVLLFHTKIERYGIQLENEIVSKIGYTIFYTIHHSP